MKPEESKAEATWDEQSSKKFIEYGRYFVPERELQIEILCDLIPPSDEPFHVLELCCGPGLLAGAMLERFPNCTVHGYDGSPEMLQHAQAALVQYGERFATEHFDLPSHDWRRSPQWPIHAAVSSLAIHHLDEKQKQELFLDIYRMLAAGGVFLIADVVQPANELGVAVAARTYDEAVRRRALELDGNTDAFDFFVQEKWNLYRYPDDPLDQPSSLFDQLKWLGQAGFIDVDVYWMKAGHAIFGGRKPITAGTLSPTATTPLNWSGTAVGGGTLNAPLVLDSEQLCQEGVTCDTFTLTIDGTPADWTGKLAHVAINWLSPTTDYDLYIHKGALSGPIVANSGNGATNPTGPLTSEETDLDPSNPDIGTGVFSVHVVYYAATAADQYKGTASVIAKPAPSPTPTPGPTPPTSTEPAPRFFNYIPPSGLGSSAGEPTLSVNFKTGNVMYIANTQTLRVAFDDSSSPAKATWANKSFLTTSVITNDPILYTDRDTGRTFVSQLVIASKQSLSAFTDNDGASSVMLRALTTRRRAQSPSLSAMTRWIM